MSKQTDLINVTDAITVDSSNNVGIGTSSPSQPLEVNGFVRLGDEAGSILDIRGSATSADGILLSSTYYGSGGFGPIKFNTSNSERMRIDSSGRVTMPYQPAFKVRTNYSSHTTINDGSPDWSQVDLNRGNHFNTSTDTFTAPVAGTYYFFTHSLMQMPSGYAYIALQVNGNRVGLTHSPNNNISSYFDLSLSEVVELSANDTVKVQCFTSGSSAGWYAGTTYNSFQGYLLG